MRRYTLGSNQVLDIGETPSDLEDNDAVRIWLYEVGGRQKRKVSVAAAINRSTRVIRGEDSIEPEDETVSGEVQATERCTVKMTRKEGQSLRIGDTITITVVSIKEATVVLGVCAPPALKVIQRTIHPLQMPAATQMFPPGTRIFWVDKRGSQPLLMTGIVERWYRMKVGWTVAVHRAAFLRNPFREQPVNRYSAWVLCAKACPPKRPFVSQVRLSASDALGDALSKAGCS